MTLSTDERETISESSDASPGLESGSLTGVLARLLGFEARTEVTAALWDLIALDTERCGGLVLVEEYLWMISSIVGFTRGKLTSAVPGRTRGGVSCCEANDVGVVGDDLGLWDFRMS